MSKDILFFTIGVIFSSFIVWVIGYFITLNVMWFYDTIWGRLIAIVFFLAIISANIRALND